MAKIISTEHLKSALTAVDNAKADDYSIMLLVGNTANYTYHRIAKKTASAPFGVRDYHITLYITHTRSFVLTPKLGIIRIEGRTNQNGTINAAARWLVREGFAADDVQIGLCTQGDLRYIDVFLQSKYQYNNVNIQSLNSTMQEWHSRTWDLVDSKEVSNTTSSDKGSSYECWASIEAAAQDLHGKSYDTVVSATDAGHVKEADKVNGHTVESNVPANALFVPAGGKEGQVLSVDAKGALVWKSL